MRNTRLPGHGLLREGRAFEHAADESSGSLLISGKLYRYTGERDGIGVCFCGEHSERLPSIAARKRWFDAHKTEVRASREERT